MLVHTARTHCFEFSPAELDILRTALTTYDELSAFPSDSLEILNVILVGESLTSGQAESLRVYLIRYAKCTTNSDDYLEWDATLTHIVRTLDSL